MRTSFKCLFVSFLSFFFKFPTQLMLTLGHLSRHKSWSIAEWSSIYYRNFISLNKSWGSFFKSAFSEKISFQCMRLFTFSEVLEKTFKFQVLIFDLIYIYIYLFVQIVSYIEFFSSFIGQCLPFNLVYDWKLTLQILSLPWEIVVSLMLFSICILNIEYESTIIFILREIYLQFIYFIEDEITAANIFSSREFIKLIFDYHKLSTFPRQLISVFSFYIRNKISYKCIEFFFFACITFNSQR